MIYCICKAFNAGAPPLTGAGAFFKLWMQSFNGFTYILRTKEVGKMDGGSSGGIKPGGGSTDGGRRRPPAAEFFTPVFLTGGICGGNWPRRIF